MTLPLNFFISVFVSLSNHFAFKRLEQGETVLGISIVKCRNFKVITWVKFHLENSGEKTRTFWELDHEAGQIDIFFSNSIKKFSVLKFNLRMCLIDCDIDANLRGKTEKTHFKKQTGNSYVIANFSSNFASVRVFFPVGMNSTGFIFISLNSFNTFIHTTSGQKLQNNDENL